MIQADEYIASLKDNQEESKNPAPELLDEDQENDLGSEIDPEQMADEEEPEDLADEDVAQP